MCVLKFSLFLLRFSPEIIIEINFDQPVGRHVKKGHPSSTLRFVLFFLFTASTFGIVHEFLKEARKDHQQNRLTLDTIGVPGLEQSSPISPPR